MAEALIQLFQLIGSLYAVGLGTAAVVTYIIIWPFDRHLRKAHA